MMQILIFLICLPFPAMAMVVKHKPPGKKQKKTFYLGLRFITRSISITA